MVEPGDKRCDCMMTRITLVSTCAPALTSITEEKVEFYTNNGDIMKSISPRSMSSSWETSAPKRVLTMTPALPVLDI